MATLSAAQFDDCVHAFLAAILDGLQLSADYIRAIERTGRGEMPVTGIALELAPWHEWLGLSLRLDSDFPLGQSRSHSADWPHFDFTESCDSPSIKHGKSLLKEVYIRGHEPGNDLRDMAHLLFLAGATALLHSDVSERLNEFDIRAPLLTDRFVSSPFQYICTDPDETLKANYCDVVMAHRIADRLLGK